MIYHTGQRRNAIVIDLLIEVADMSGKEEKRGGATVYRAFSQDLFKTGIHLDKIGVHQDDQWRSQSRQFNKDAEIIGKIEEAKLAKGAKELPKKEKVGFIVIREATWRDEPNDINRRMVLKFFTNNGAWLATIEEMVAQEYATSFGSEAPLLAFSVVTKESEIVTYILQSRRGTLATEHYSFYLVGPDGKFEVFRIEGARIAIGDDFNVFRLTGETAVARINSKVIDIGGDYEVTINDATLAENEWFCRVLQCFSVAVKYRDEIRERLQKGLRSWIQGKARPTQQRYELSLLANPRRITLQGTEFEEV
jgi:hypothetical protein